MILLYDSNERTPSEVARDDAVTYPVLKFVHLLGLTLWGRG